MREHIANRTAFQPPQKPALGPEYLVPVSSRPLRPVPLEIPPLRGKSEASESHSDTLVVRDYSHAPGHTNPRNGHGQRHSYSHHSGHPSDRTTARHGLTWPEIQRLDAACHFMNRYRRDGHLLFASFEPGCTRELISNFQKRITKLQGTHKLHPYTVWVFECESGLHSHLLFIGDSLGLMAKHLVSSRLFSPLVSIKPVRHLHNLVKYLSKERTPQAGYRRQSVLGRRVPGSHRLEGGGDRVRVSRELERDAVDAGLIRPWKHTYARRSSTRKPYARRRVNSLF
jgi:hypothetical protein